MICDQISLIEIYWTPLEVFPVVVTEELVGHVLNCGVMNPGHRELLWGWVAGVRFQDEQLGE